MFSVEGDDGIKPALASQQVWLEGSGGLPTLVLNE